LSPQDTFKSCCDVIVTRGATQYKRFCSFCMGSFIVPIENLVLAVVFCNFSIIRFADLDRWGTVAVFWVIVCGIMYWKLSDKGDNKEKNAEFSRKLGPNESKIEILAKIFKFANHWLLTVRNWFWNVKNVFIPKKL
jgi:hypothetical protein